MKKLMFVLIASTVCSAFAMNASAQQADQATTDSVIAMTKAQWAAEIKDPTNVAEQSKDMSDDYTEFNADYATRLDGKAMNSRLAEASGKESGKTIASEMANPKVQVYNGNVAILTYNYVGLTMDKDGKTTPSRAKSTRVFVKKVRNGRWSTQTLGQIHCQNNKSLENLRKGPRVRTLRSGRPFSCTRQKAFFPTPINHQPASTRT